MMYIIPHKTKTDSIGMLEGGNIDGRENIVVKKPL